MKFSLAFLLVLAPFAHAGRFDYPAGPVTCEGYLAGPTTGQHPGILIVHDWMGPGKFSKAKADELAKLGYVALAVDIYGQGVRPKDAQEAGAQAGKYKSDRPLLRARITAALDALKQNPNVDPKRIAAIGYCFGGTTVLELARSGADIAGVVSFHGGLDAPLPAKTIRCKILALHGADDPYVPPAEVAAFEKEMTDAHADWQLVKYSGAVHSFTNPDAHSAGAAYHERADKRSWEAMKLFFAEIFR